MRRLSCALSLVLCFIPDAQARRGVGGSGSYTDTWKGCGSAERVMRGAVYAYLVFFAGMLAWFAYDMHSGR